MEEVDMLKPRRSKKKLTYHGREGYPIIHYENGKAYIMVRKKGGGTKRLYLVKGNVPKHLREKRKTKMGRKKKKSKKKKKWGNIGAPQSAKRKRHLARIRKRK